MTQEQQEFYNAMATAIEYSGKNMDTPHTENLKRTLNAFCLATGIESPQRLANALTRKQLKENISLPEIILSPEAVPNKWDSVEIQPVHFDQKENAVYVVDEYSGEDEQDDDADEINFYSVYLHKVDGGVSCVADCTTSEQAEKLAALLQEAGEHYQSYEEYQREQKLRRELESDRLKDAYFTPFTAPAYNSFSDILLKSPKKQKPTQFLKKSQPKKSKK